VPEDKSKDKDAATVAPIVPPVAPDDSAANAPKDAADKPEKKDTQPDTIEIPPQDAPIVPPAVDPAEVAALQAELTDKQTELEQLRAELAAARNVRPEPVEVELESGMPKWVRLVSGMERSEINGWVDLPGNLLIVEDKQGGQHRFTYLSSQKPS